MKKTFLITFLFFIYSCGYTSVYKNLGNQDFQIIITEMLGDKKMNNLIKNEINLYANRNPINSFDVTIDTKYEKLIIAKNTSGVATDYQLSVDSKFTIYFNEKSKKITLSESINIKNQTDTFDQDLYEKNIKINFASTIREKLISEIINLK